MKFTPLVGMALAPLILYTCAASGQTDPSLYLYAMFAASNLASIALMFGNPTNLIVAVASEMTFFSYAKAMVLPRTGRWRAAAPPRMVHPRSLKAG